jgi:acetoin utilization deacetylase AcuC-like enzyme
MRNIYFVADPFCLQHLTGPYHPETPLRYKAIDDILSAAKLKTKENTLTPKKASRSDLLFCHSETYINIVEDDRRRCVESKIHDGTFSLSTGDVQISPPSLEAALLAAGAGMTAVDAVMEGTANTVFSYLRPPGHHACRNRGMGFCLFNNAAIAARYAQTQYSIPRVLIADWDVHHGNGTQDIFDEDSSVFYFSTHQAGIYPGTGSAEDTGTGKGKGTKLNFPIASSSASRLQVLEAFKGPLVDSMKEFKPNFVIISAGFDGHFADPLGGFNLTEADFSELTQVLMQIADTYAEGRLISLLEGGYNLQALARSALAHSQALMQK